MQTEPYSRDHLNRALFFLSSQKFAQFLWQNQLSTHWESAFTHSGYSVTVTHTSFCVEAKNIMFVFVYILQIFFCFYQNPITVNFSHTTFPIQIHLYFEQKHI